MQKLALIPARSGSKRIKDKNIRLFNGHPLISYTIQAAIQSQIFDEIIFATDSEEYADIARYYGATVPFLRENNPQIIFVHIDLDIYGPTKYVLQNIKKYLVLMNGVILKQ